MSVKVIISLICSLHGTLGAIPPCFHNGTSWHSDGLTDVVTNVADIYACQESCAASNCSGFTYYTIHSQHFPRICGLYGSLGREEECQDCISGPPSCTCSGQFSCDVVGDNVIDVLSDVKEESQCQNFCFNAPGCNFYTYFDKQNIMEGLCYLFSSCEQIDETCVGCFTGPPVCNPTTTAIPPKTTSSTNVCESGGYRTLDDPSRSVNYSGPENYCDSPYLWTSPDWAGPGWYRISGAAGTKLPETPPQPSGPCGTQWPGWMRDGGHPLEEEGQVARQVCFNNDEGVPCDTFAVDISVINCGSFYLYFLPNTPTCSLRYCAV